jgi:hypothetical protein
MAGFAFEVEGDFLVRRIGPEELDFLPRRIWNPSPSVKHRTEPYPLPHALDVGIFGNRECGSKFSPPPFAVVVENDERRALVHVAADPGWHLWNQVLFEGSKDGALAVRIDLEGHSQPGDVAAHVRLAVEHATPGEARHALLARGLREAYPEASAPGEGEMPAWWRRPIYCGWGDQVSASMWLEGPGPERRALAYCIQGLYERWIARLDEAGVPFGTSIIDHGWSPAGSWEADPVRWPDLKGFIAREHGRGRRVLLWIATWLWDGLPDEWCVFADGVKLVADPTNPDYLAFVEKRVAGLLGSGGLDADGFKIDQLAYSPSERRPRGGPRFGWTGHREPSAEPLALHGEGWGCELLHRLQKTIYDAAKKAKPDALITSSTVHPYFHDTFDMSRLHDTGNVNGDVIEAMRARAELSHAAAPGKPIDADDWVHTDYAQWLAYTRRSRELGVPCIFYAERFVLDWKKEPATREIPAADLRAIAEAWAGL